MTYNFDSPTDRRGTNSYKWDSSDNPDILPMWVADMDFRTAPCITDALRRRVDQGIFGYTLVGEDYYAAVCDWFRTRHGWAIDPRTIIYTSGVVPALSAIIKALARPGDKVLVQTPVYNCFFSSIRNNGCGIDECPLVYKDGDYSIDFADFERHCADPAVRLFLLCNPHNPAGRVWTRDELTRMGEIALRHDVIVISDEIHCELVFPPYCYTPFASISPDFAARSVTCVSPSKAFNIAGLQIANIVCADGDMRMRIDRAINDNEVCDVNPFGVIATVEAYRNGAEWLEQLLEYIHGNYTLMAEYCAEHLPAFTLTRLEGTYLVWMDCRALGIPSAVLEEELRDETGLWLNAGTMYGPAGEGFMRWNIAIQRTRLRDGLARFTRFVTARLIP